MKAILYIPTTNTSTMIDFKSSYSVVCTIAVNMLKQQQICTHKSTFYYC